MQFNDLVSIVMPVHNGEKYLREAINSVLEQTYTNFELIIVENCSIDSSIVIIESYSDPRIRLFVEKTCGNAEAYNKGIRESRGEYIFIHDHDDISDKNRISKQLNYITKYNLDIVGSYHFLADPNGKILTKVLSPIDRKEIELNYYFKVTSLYNPTLCFKRDVFQKYGYYDQEYYPSSDFEFGLRVITHSKIGNVSEPLLIWRNHSSSLSHKDMTFGNEKALELSEKYLKLNRENYTKREYIYIQSNIYYYYNHLWKSLYCIISNLNCLNIKLNLLIIKITIFFIPIKFLRKFDLFNSSFVLTIRKYFF